MGDRSRLLLLFSDTGGGHRSAAQAIVQALRRHFPGEFSPVLVDVLKDHMPIPFRLAPQLYPDLVRLPQVWGLGYRLLDGRRRARVLDTACWPYLRSHIRRLVRQQPADIIISTHPLVNSPVIRALGRHRPPFLTMVTDLVSTPAFWYDRRVDLCLTPTARARTRALDCGLRPDQVRVVGLPVGEAFCTPPEDPSKLRDELGWPKDRPTVLVVGGGEGMGPLYETARAIDRRGEHLSLAVVAGRNRQLKQRLEQAEWRLPAFFYGFEKRMPQMMAAADLLVTKAGPGTISEALNSALPLVLCSRLPGQEDGNVGYVVEEGVGLWAPGPERSAAAVVDWLRRPEDLAAARERCRKIARPEAAKEVAQIIHTYLPLRTFAGAAREPAVSAAG